MIRTALLVGTAALVPLLSAQDVDETPVDPPAPQVSLAPDWTVGSTYRLELTKTRQRGEGKQIGTITPVTVTVRAEHDDGYSLRWTFGQAEFIGMGPEQAGFAADLANIFQGTSLDFRTDQYGTPTTLENSEAVREHAESLLDRVEEQALNDGAPPAQLQQILGPARSMVLGDMLATTVLNEPSLYYFPSGMQLRVGEVQEFEETLPNPFGGSPFEATSKLLLESLDADTNSATIIYRLEIDAEKARDNLLETFTRIAESQGRPAPTAAQLPEVHMIDESEYELDLATNLPHSMAHVRTTTVAGSVQTERISLRVLPRAEKDDE